MQLKLMNSIYFQPSFIINYLYFLQMKSDQDYES